METRRQLLKTATIFAAAAATSLPGVAIAAEQVEDCERDAHKLCDSLSRKYGGTWQFQLTAGQDVMLLCKIL
ncbi:twin-arginine translocation signal domain-containing protein [Rhizobium lusitanum]